MNNIKRICMIALVLIYSVVLTGCFSHEVRTKVYKNGKADISMIFMGDNSNDMDEIQSIYGDLIASLESKGWERTPYNENRHVGYEMIKREINLLDIGDAFDECDDLLGKIYDDDTLSNFYEAKVEKHGLNYIFELEIPPFKDVAYSESDDLHEVTFFTLELPYKPLTSNATSVSRDGRTLEWDLYDIAKEGIYVEFRLFYISSITVRLALGCCFLIAIAVAIIVLNKSSKASSYDKL